jgi:hypothetical protein
MLFTEKWYFVSLGAVMIGMFNVPLIPILLEFSIEIAFPVAEGTTVGILFASGEIFGLLMILIESLILEGSTKTTVSLAILVFGSFFGASLFATIFITEKLNRTNAENRNSRGSTDAEKL